MTRPSALIFIDLPSSDPAASAAFYAEVFGWETDARPEDLFHRLLPGGTFARPDGSDSDVGNLHMGVYRTDVAAPDPFEPPLNGTEGPSGAPVRVYILVGDGDSEAAILERAERAGADILWRDLYWSEFNGFHGAFRDPWGNQIILWTKAPEDADVRPDQAHWQSSKGY